MDMWEKVGLLGGMIPGVAPVAQGIARNTVQRLLGFWVLWHLYGGLEGMIASGVGSSSSVYRQVGEFRSVFGVDVDEWSPELAAEIRKAGGR